MCPLCERKEIMPVIYEDDKFWITYCMTHTDCPLVILKEHRPRFSKEEAAWIVSFVSKRWPRGTVRWNMASIPEHAHAHIEERYKEI